MAASCVCSCSKTQQAVAESSDAIKESAEATTDASTRIVEQLDDAVAGVVDVTDDAAYRPDTKVKQLTILDFNATWCGPCKMFAPAFDTAAEKFAGKAVFASVDVDNCPETANAFGIRAVPTLVLLRPDGKTVRYEGTQDLLPAEKFEKIVKDNL